jgi:hypothetical protein
LRLCWWHADGISSNHHPHLHLLPWCGQGC